MVLLGTHYEGIQLLYKNSDETEIIMLERPSISVPVDNHSEPWPSSYPAQATSYHGAKTNHPAVSYLNSYTTEFFNHNKIALYH